MKIYIYEKLDGMKWIIQRAKIMLFIGEKSDEKRTAYDYDSLLSITFL